MHGQPAHVGALGVERVHRQLERGGRHHGRVAPRPRGRRAARPPPAAPRCPARSPRPPPSEQPVRRTPATRGLRPAAPTCHRDGSTPPGAAAGRSARRDEQQPRCAVHAPVLVAEGAASRQPSPSHARAVPRPRRTAGAPAPPRSARPARAATRWPSRSRAAIAMANEWQHGQVSLTEAAQERPVRRRGTSRSMRDGDGWRECALGHKHWGVYGAAGLLLVAPGPDRPVSRAAWSHHGGTWGCRAEPAGRRSPPYGCFREAGDRAGRGDAAGGGRLARRPRGLDDRGGHRCP